MPRSIHSACDARRPDAICIILFAIPHATSLGRQGSHRPHPAAPIWSLQDCVLARGDTDGYVTPGLCA
ncbi:MAG: hypothetical protein ABSG58_08195, partial [Acidimicrobiales bacterium]